MKNQFSGKKSKGNPIKLVWLITLLSFSVGVFMVYFIWSTLTDIRTERENLFELKQNFISTQTTLESGLAKQKSELTDLLEAKLNINNQIEDLRLINLIRDYGELFPIQISSPPFKSLKEILIPFSSLKIN